MGHRMAAAEIDGVHQHHHAVVDLLSAVGPVHHLLPTALIIPRKLLLCHRKTRIQHQIRQLRLEQIALQAFNPLHTSVPAASLIKRSDVDPVRQKNDLGDFLLASAHPLHLFQRAPGRVMVENAGRHIRKRSKIPDKQIPVDGVVLRVLRLKLDQSGYLIRFVRPHVVQQRQKTDVSDLPRPVSAFRHQYFPHDPGHPVSVVHEPWIHIIAGPPHNPQKILRINIRPIAHPSPPLPSNHVLPGRFHIPVLFYLIPSGDAINL